MSVDLWSATTGAVMLVVFVATLTRALFGFGAALVAMPLLTLAIGVRQAAPLVSLIGILISALILAQSWRSVEWRGMWQLTLASVVGVPFGLLFLKEAYAGTVKTGLGLVVAAFALYRLFDPRLVVVNGSWAAYLAGFVAGVLGGAYNASGPPVVVYGTLARWSVEGFRATLQGYFLLVGLIVLVGHGLSGSLTGSVWQLFALSLPAIGLGTAAGLALSRVIPQARLRRTMYVLMLILGIVLIVNSV